MAAPRGQFGADLTLAGWFDQDLVPAGQFDADLLTDAQATVAQAEAADALSGAAVVQCTTATASTEATDTVSAVVGVIDGAALSSADVSDVVPGEFWAPAFWSSRYWSTAYWQHRADAPASVIVSDSLATTDAADTLSADGSITGTIVLADASVTEADDSLASAGAVAVSGSEAGSEPSDTLIADSLLVAGAALDASERAETLAAASSLLVAADFAVSEADDDLLASGFAEDPNAANLSLEATDDDDELSAAAKALQYATGDSGPIRAVFGSPRPTRSGDLVSRDADDVVAGRVFLTLVARASATESADGVRAEAGARVQARMRVVEDADRARGSATADYSGLIRREDRLIELAASAGPIALFFDEAA